MTKPWSDGLALALIAGPWTLPEMVARTQEALGAKPNWIRPMCLRVLQRFAALPREDELPHLAEHIRACEPLVAANLREPIRVRRWFLPEPQSPLVLGAPAGFAVPRWATTGDMASALGVSAAQLDWFADLRHFNRRGCPQALRNYRFRWVAKRSGGHRLLETPKSRIKAVQRSILHDVLAMVPPDPAAHGFVPGRSVLSFVAPHVGRSLVLRMDLEDFFATITGPRVRALFQRLGYPTLIARKLAGLCCIETPPDVLRAHPGADSTERFHTSQRLRVPHLPQGAPTSPALSNLIAFKLDRRLAGLARSRGLAYTRYADDLAFSGGPAFEKGVDRFIAYAAAIVIEEGFRVRFRKTRVMRAAVRQQLAGIVVNRRPNLSRRDYDALRATLHNAIELGPASQNRAEHADFHAHLRGRIAWFALVHPGRGARLHALFDRIDWER